MVKVTSFFISLVFILSLLVTPVWAGGGKVRGGNANGFAGDIGDGTTERNRGLNNSVGSLTEEEIHHLIYMVEEKKLARDVYLTLYDTYNSQIFLNISESEQRYMDALIKLIEKYNLENPVIEEFGSFTNPVFTELYQNLIGKGVEDYCNALQVGIDIETFDIADIELALSEIEARDLSRALNNLLNGSYNHLNLFTSQCEFNQCD